MPGNNENLNPNSPLGDGGINVLMTGAGAPGAAGILKCLQLILFSWQPTFRFLTVSAIIKFSLLFCPFRTLAPLIRIQNLYLQRCTTLELLTSFSPKNL